jgi:TolA-binding protein
MSPDTNLAARAQPEDRSLFILSGTSLPGISTGQSSRTDAIEAMRPKTTDHVAYEKAVDNLRQTNETIAQLRQQIAQLRMRGTCSPVYTFFPSRNGVK